MKYTDKMPQTDTEQYNQLKRILTQMFQLDQAELDFGIYRIMNQKREEITDFLDRDLLTQIRRTLEQSGGGARQQAKAKLEELEKTLRSAGVDPETNDKVIELRTKYERTGSIDGMEREIYSHLSRFFGRYYKEGDFISQRRYKKDVYAIPYEGEEVKLYWANYDQYYIKTGEYFKNYVFKADGKAIHFILKEADTERDNNKAQSGKERRFKLFREDNQPSFEETEKGELNIYFTYEPADKKETQKNLNEQILRFLTDKLPGKWTQVLLQRKPTDKNKNRTLLEYRLTDYTAKNSFDYFIHKDLGKFLRRELDFYIKNEMLHIDDIDLDEEQYFQGQLTLVKAFKKVATKIITFLAQLEDFQKKLFLKKKMVLQSDYCITLDRVDQSFYKDIATNEKQIKEWMRLFAIDELFGFAKDGWRPLTEKELQDNPFLLVDTQFFPLEWKYRLLSTIPNIDQQCDGLLINSENFQALNLLRRKYKERIDIIYIDPPYNTEKDRATGKFIYKDGFTHSSWLSLMSNRLEGTGTLLSTKGVLIESLDENEYSNQMLLLKNLLDYIGTVVLQTATDNNPTQINTEHEYILFFAKDKRNLNEWFGKSKGAELIIQKYDELLRINGNNPEVIQNGLRKWIKANKEKLNKVTHYDNVDKKGVFHDADVANTKFGGYIYQILHPLTHRPCKIPDKGFRFPEETMKELIANDEILFGKDETTLIKPKKRVENVRDLLRSIIYEDGRASTKTFENMFEKGAFPNPKSDTVLSRIFGFPFNSKDILLLDYFAGSGTTAHAVINLNREDGGKRKYILVEMGEYFNTVTKPRVQKVIYSKDWKDGKPVGREGISQCFKYMRLESYEDTLNNLVLKQTEIDKQMQEEYLLRYSLDIESRDSLLMLDVFKKPFGHKIKSTENNELKETEVDLVETFNYLIGLQVKTMEIIRGYWVITGETLDEKQVLIIWRDLDRHSNQDLNEFCKTMRYNPLDTEFDRIYVNGDNNIENLKTGEEHWKVQLIEHEFHKRMWELV